MANDTNKIKLLVLWDILCKNTDENHAMNSDEIREELAKRGIGVMRKVWKKFFSAKSCNLKQGSASKGQMNKINHLKQKNYVGFYYGTIGMRYLRLGFLQIV